MNLNVFTVRIHLQIVLNVEETEKWLQDASVLQRHMRISIAQIVLIANLDVLHVQIQLIIVEEIV